MNEPTTRRGRRSGPSPEAAGAFARAVRTARIERGWSQEQLARAADVSAGTINNLERGRQGASLVTALKLARVLGLSLDSLEG